MIDIVFLIFLAFLNFASLQLFFDLYHALPSTLSPLVRHRYVSRIFNGSFTSMIWLFLQALACLIQIASVRRSLFSNAERAKFLDKIVSGVKGILDAPQVPSCPPPPLGHFNQFVLSLTEIVMSVDPNCPPFC